MRAKPVVLPPPYWVRSPKHWTCSLEALYMPPSFSRSSSLEMLARLGWRMSLCKCGESANCTSFGIFLRDILAGGHFQTACGVVQFARLSLLVCLVEYPKSEVCYIRAASIFECHNDLQLGQIIPPLAIPESERQRADRPNEFAQPRAQRYQAKLTQPSAYVPTKGFG